MGVSDRWFVDAWAVRDGALFVSRRSPGGYGDASNTVFLSVPTLEPVAVGRISTALRATRVGFQAGFFDEEGQEIPFEELSDLQELARRGYLASGMGDGGAARVSGPQPSGPFSEWPSARFLAQQPTDIDPWSRWYSGDGRHLDQELAQAAAQREVRALVRAYAQAITLDWEACLEIESQAPEEWLDLGRRRAYELESWYSVLFSCGIWPNESDFFNFLDRGGCPIGAGLGPAWIGMFRFRHADVRERHGDYLQAAAPANLSVRGVEPYAPLLRLSEHRLLLQCDAEHPFAHPSLMELVPALLSAVIAAPSRLTVNDLERLQRPEGKRLFSTLNLPSGRLPRAAEVELTKYSRGMIAPENPDGTGADGKQEVLSW